eukprot:4560993-Pyramimonas_sp.AAC.1
MKHDAMIKALARFETGGDSSTRQQRAEIAQGYPLSPYLFVVVQTVVVFDVDKLFNELGMGFVEPDYVACNDVLCAGDAMLVSASFLKVQLLLDSWT